MPRTFTLSHLLLAVTLFCILCGLAVNLSGEEELAYAFSVASLAPAAIVCLTLVSFSRQRKTVLISSLVGALIGAWFGLPMHGGPPMTVWQAIEPVFLPIAISAALGALLFGAAALKDDTPTSPKRQRG